MSYVCVLSSNKYVSLTLAFRSLLLEAIPGGNRGFRVSRIGPGSDKVMEG